MAIPSFQTLMLPILEVMQDGEEYSIGGTAQKMAEWFNLTEQEQNQKLPSGRETTLRNRVNWARTYLKKAGLLKQTRRGYARITPQGEQVLNENLYSIDIQFLKQFPEFSEDDTARQEGGEGNGNTAATESALTADYEEQTPTELIETGFALHKKQISEELLGKLREVSPSFFEWIILQLLNKMAYGEGKVTGHTGDGGVDGFINQDKLGLDRIFFQAKRFSEGNAVPAAMVRDFVGTLDVNGVTKGVLITTSHFPTSATEVLRGTQKNIILVDGNKLVNLMLEHSVGVRLEQSYEVKRLDYDFFAEED